MAIAKAGAGASVGSSSGAASRRDGEGGARVIRAPSLGCHDGAR
jgi:hypothetical protein